MQHFIKRVERLERGVLSLLVLSSIVMSVIGVFYRYFLNNSLSFVEELAGLMLAGMIVLGSSIAVTQKEHIRVTLLATLWKRGERALDALAWLTMLGVSLVMTGLTARFVQKLLAVNQMSTSLEWLPVGWPLLIMPVGYLLCALKSLSLLWATLSGQATGGSALPADMEEVLAAAREVKS